MRYYNIEITDAGSGKLVKQFTSLNTLGQNIPGALNIEIDIPVFQMAEPAGEAYVKVWGISLQDIGQSFDLNNKIISVYAGMSKGLPLANFKQAGLVLQGVITQAFGNWQGLEQSLDFIINVVGGSTANPKNIVQNWTKGQTLGASVKQTLAVAFPDYTFEDKTSAALVLNQDEPGYYETVSQFAAYVKRVSQHINPAANYQGANIVVKNKKFTLYDGTSPTNPIAIQFVDLIGQPSWIEFSVIGFKCAMRADLNVSDYITMPQAQVKTTAQSQSQYRDKTTFAGKFQIKNVRHIGNFRQPDANSWVTVFEAYVP